MVMVRVTAIVIAGMSADTRVAVMRVRASASTIVNDRRQTVPALRALKAEVEAERTARGGPTLVLRHLGKFNQAYSYGQDVTSVAGAHRRWRCYS